MERLTRNGLLLRTEIGQSIFGPASEQTGRTEEDVMSTASLRPHVANCLPPRLLPGHHMLPGTLRAATGGDSLPLTATQADEITSFPARGGDALARAVNGHRESQGVQLARLKLAQYWATDYDWASARRN